MGETADAVVVGAGLNGAATAFFLLRDGLRRVIVLDAGRPAGGASGAAVGLLRSHYDNRPETELAARSMPFFRNWDEHVGGGCGWRQTGFFRFVEAEELENMHRNVAVQREFGEEVEILTPQDVRDSAPAFRTDDIGAVVYEPASGTASNSRATLSLLEKACARGGVVAPYTAAIRINVDNDRVTGIFTSRGTISTPIVVLAAGVGCKSLAASCGQDLPLEARSIRVAEIVLPDGAQVPGSFMDPISDSWIAPRYQGRALISAPRPASPAPDAESDGEADFSRAEARAGLPAVCRRFPGAAGANIVRWWTRADTYAPDGKPVIGRAPMVEGLFLNTAGAGKGHKTAPAAGVALSELILAGTSRTADLLPFDVSRFGAPAKSWSESEYRKRVIG